MPKLNVDLSRVLAIEPRINLYVRKDDGKDVQIFTRGKRYMVEKWLHDLRVTDDTGTGNHVGGEYLTTNFMLHLEIPEQGRDSDV